MNRSTRARRDGGAGALGSPPLVKIQNAKTSSASCDLNETIDEYDAELLLAADEESSKTAKGKQTGNQSGKRKRKANTDDDDKENNHSLPGKRAKWKKGLALAPLAERLTAAERAASQESSVKSTQESPPIFAFKQGKTALKARKLRKEKQETQEGNQKRLDDLAAYFANVDAEKLAYL